MSKSEALKTKHKTECSVRLCKKSPVGESPITCQPLCDLHIQSDLAKVAQSESDVAARIQHFKKYTKPLRLMQQRLASDLQLLDDAFNDLRDAVDKCQKELVEVITNQHDELLDSLRIIAELEDFEKELREAKDRNDSRQAFLINDNMEKSLESVKLDNKLVCMDKESEEVRMIAYPDVSSYIQDLIICSSSQINLLQMILETLDKKSNKESQTKFVTKCSEEKIDLESKAVCITMCSNVSGFIIDSSGNISKAEDVADTHALPHPSVFVAVQSRDFEDKSSPDSKIHLLSVDGKLILTLKCSWDSNQQIINLHCDEKRQQLFIAQKLAVIVTDLSGDLQSRISITDVDDGAQEIHCITGDCDKLFIGMTVKDKGSVIFGVSKQSGEVQLKIPVTCVESLTQCKIFERNRMIKVDSGENRYTICSITGLMITSEKLNKQKFHLLGNMSFDDAILVYRNGKMMLDSTRCFGICLPVKFALSGELFIVEQTPLGCKLMCLINGDIVVCSASAVDDA